MGIPTIMTKEAGMSAKADPVLWVQPYILTRRADRLEKATRGFLQKRSTTMGILNGIFQHTVVRNIRLVVVCLVICVVIACVYAMFVLNK